jgi:hypothetical protein
MATIATIDLPTTEFALYNKFVGIPAIRVEIEIDRPVTAENEQRSSSVRVSATDHRSDDEIERALATDLSVAALDRFAALDGEWLYRIAWAEATQASVRILTRKRGDDSDRGGSAQHLDAPDAVPRARGARADL